MVAYNYKYKLCNLKIMVAHNHIACYNVKKGEVNMYSGRICPKCGKSTTENDAFCPFCGKNLLRKNAKKIIVKYFTEKYKR
ncbi:MAG: zinc-ribbon domain-containing protein [Christensenellales bacterium]